MGLTLCDHGRSIPSGYTKAYDSVTVGACSAKYLQIATQTPAEARKNHMLRKSGAQLWHNVPALSCRKLAQESSMLRQPVSSTQSRARILHGALDSSAPQSACLYLMRR
jgi:hypothetical protein